MSLLVSSSSKKNFAGFTLKASAWNLGAKGRSKAESPYSTLSVLVVCHLICLAVLGRQSYFSSSIDHFVSGDE